MQGDPICRGIKRDDGTTQWLMPEKMFLDDKSPYRLVRVLATQALDVYGEIAGKKRAAGGAAAAVAEKKKLQPLKNIVLFDDALEHLMRLHRVIRMPRGSALLIGYGGSGRRSLTRLAAFMAGYALFEI